MDHIRTYENLANPLTKGLAREKVHNTSKKMKLILIDKSVAHDGIPTYWRSQEIGSMDNNKL